MALQVISEPTTFTGGLSANNFPISVGSGDVVLLASATASASTSITFDNVFDASVYAEYELRFQGVHPATDNVDLRVQLRNATPADITSTHQNNLFTNRIDSAASGNNANQGGITGWRIGGPLGTTDTNRRISANVTISPFASQWTIVRFSAWVYLRATSGIFELSGAGQCQDTTAPAGVKIYMSSGNIASGTFQLYGLKK